MGKAQTQIMISFALVVFAFMLAFLFATAACKAGDPPPRFTQYHNGWIVRGSATPWSDASRPICSILYYL